MIPGLERIEYPKCDATVDGNPCAGQAFYIHMGRWFMCIDCQRNIGHDSVSLPHDGTVQEWARKQSKLTDVGL